MAFSHNHVYVGRAKKEADAITNGRYYGGAYIGRVYDSPNGTFKWMINGFGWIWIAQIARLNILGEKRPGWKIFRLEKDGMLRQMGFRDFIDPEKAFEEWKNIRTIN